VARKSPLARALDSHRSARLSPQWRHARGSLENFPDLIDVWSQYFRDIPCALTLVPAKDYSSSESMLVNLIALKNGAGL
jgi:hypothetical protein